jgi:hypothetical protein
MWDEVTVIYFIVLPQYALGTEKNHKSIMGSSLWLGFKLVASRINPIPHTLPIKLLL